MQFNFKSLLSILAVMQTINASAAEAAANAVGNAKFIYETVTLLDDSVVIPTGTECDEDGESSTYSLSNIHASSKYSQYHSFSSSTLQTVYHSNTFGTVEASATSTKAQAQSVAATKTVTQETTTSAAVTSSSIFDSEIHNGIATFYSVSADNCGTSSTDNDFVCAISQQMYNTVANSESISEYCGHMINITYGGKTIQVKVVDSCASCDANHLDLSPAAFTSLANADLGVIDIQWTWA